MVPEVSVFTHACAHTPTAAATEWWGAMGDETADCMGGEILKFLANTEIVLFLGSRVELDVDQS